MKIRSKIKKFISFLRADISFKIFILIVFPMIGLIHLSFEKAYQQTIEYYTAEKIMNLSKAEILIDELIFNLQKERGRSQIFMVYLNQKYRDELLTRHEKTNESFTKVAQISKDKIEKKFILNEIMNLLSQRVKIDEMRKRILENKVSSLEAFDFYTEIINACLNIRYNILKEIDDMSLYIELQKSLILTEIAEKVARYRALVVFQLASAREFYQYDEKIDENMRNQNFFEEFYFKMASPMEREEYKNLVQNIKLKETKERLLKKNIKTIEDSEFWWQIASEKIANINNIKKDKLSEVNKNLNKMKKQSILRLTISLFQLMLTLTLTVLIAFRIIKYVESQIFYDILTGLPNRKFFFKQFELILYKAERYSEPFSVAILDIDDFKKINDIYGHDAGDHILRELSNIIRKNIRKSDIPARLGGEEFAIIFQNISFEKAYEAVDRIRQKFNEREIYYNEEKIISSISGGIVEYSKGANMENLLKKADTALYRAKREGKNKIVRYSKEIDGGN